MLFFLLSDALPERLLSAVLEEGLVSSCAESCENLPPGIERRRVGQGYDSFRLLRCLGCVASQGPHSPLSSHPAESGDRSPISIAAIAIRWAHEPCSAPLLQGLEQPCTPQLGGPNIIVGLGFSFFPSRLSLKTHFNHVATIARLSLQCLVMSGHLSPVPYTGRHRTVWRWGWA